MEILNNSQIALVNPLLWEDPYECLLYKRPHVLEDGSTRTLEPIIKNMFGSCWTLNYNTDFSWKVYAPGKNGIQLKVKISDLYHHFQFLNNDPNTISFQIGKVVYLKQKALRDKISHKQKLNTFEMIMNTSLFYKRFNFRHEREIRILIRLADGMNQNLKFVDFDSNKLIYSVLLDPRIESEKILSIKEKIKNSGYKKRIYRSRLYTPPKLESIVYIKIRNICNIFF